MQNKNTTILGIATLLGLAGSVLTAIFDGDVATTVDYGAVAAGLFAAIGLIFARDAKPTDPIPTKTDKGVVLVEKAPTVPPSAV